MKSIMDTEDGKCYLCGRITGTETHHIFSGTANRKLSDADGLTVELCHLCHYRVHNGKQAPMLRYMLHLEGQTRYEEHYGPDLQAQGIDPHEHFRRRYGRNYL